MTIMDVGVEYLGAIGGGDPATIGVPASATPSDAPTANPLDGLALGDVDAVAAAGGLRFIESKSRSASRQARDDVGRWRKIYYRLRRTQSSEAKVRKALGVVKETERRAEHGGIKRSEQIETIRNHVKGLGLTEEIDERASAKLIKDAKDAANLMRRLEARGRGTLVSFSQLPQAMQDAIKEYLRQINLEPRITKHFGPFAKGKIRRSIGDVLNLIDRVVVDSQQYTKGYDLERSSR